MITFDILRKGEMSGKISQTDMYRINKELHLKRCIVGNIKFVLRPLWGDFVLIEGNNLNECTRCSTVFGFREFKSAVLNIIYAKKSVEDYLINVPEVAR